MNDAQVNRFLNEIVRPVAEKIRNLRLVLQQARQIYANGIDAKLAAAGTDVINDGRNAEGLPLLKASEVVAFMTLVESLLTTINDSQAIVVAKHCVRPVEIVG